MAAKKKAEKPAAKQEQAAQPEPRKMLLGVPHSILGGKATVRFTSKAVDGRTYGFIDRTDGSRVERILVKGFDEAEARARDLAAKGVI
ncbi:MAG: hypothetical protein AB7O39_03225 [Flavobacteriaceae bacterium]